MPEKNSATTFIGLLTEAYEADRLIRKARLSAQHQAQADQFKEEQLAALFQFRDALEPLDCVQLMAPALHNRHLG